MSGAALVAAAMGPTIMIGFGLVRAVDCDGAGPAALRHGTLPVVRAVARRTLVVVLRTVWLVCTWSLLVSLAILLGGIRALARTNTSAPRWR